LSILNPLINHIATTWFNMAIFETWCEIFTDLFSRNALPILSTYSRILHPCMLFALGESNYAIPYLLVPIRFLGFVEMLLEHVPVPFCVVDGRYSRSRCFVVYRLLSLAAITPIVLKMQIKHFTIPGKNQLSISLFCVPLLGSYMNYCLLSPKAR